MKRKFFTRLAVIAVASIGLSAQASVILNSGKTYFLGAGGSSIGTLQRSSIPMASGFQGIGYGGTGSTVATSQSGNLSAIEASIEGFGTGTLDVPVSLQLYYTFTITGTDGGPLKYDLYGSFDAGGETWYGVGKGTVTGAGSHTVSGTIDIAGLSGATVLPAGASFDYFLIQAFFGTGNGADPYQKITLDIPASGIYVTVAGSGGSGGGGGGGTGGGGGAIDPDPGVGDPVGETPEPSTYMMLGLGLSLLGMKRR